MNNLEDLTLITENLISEINYIIRHDNRYKLTRINISRLQTIRESLKKDLVYYKFISRAKCGIDINMIIDKSNYVNIISSEINTFKRLLQ